MVLKITSAEVVETQSPTSVLFITTLTWKITLYELLILLGSNHLLSRKKVKSAYEPSGSSGLNLSSFLTWRYLRFLCAVVRVVRCDVQRRSFVIYVFVRFANINLYNSQSKNSGLLETELAPLKSGQGNFLS